MRGLLGETIRLLVGHLHLFTLISLTVWLPGHLARNYIEFFEEAAGGAAESVRLGLMLQFVFDPLIVSATLAALGRIKQGLPVSYRAVMLEGLQAWGRLFTVRFLVNGALLLPVLGASLLRPGGRGMALAGFGLLLTGVVLMVLLVRFAVVDSVVVLERLTVATAWRRAAALTRGQRWAILGVLLVLVTVVLAPALLAGRLFHIVPELNHFVVRVLFDCALAVAQSLFTIALFLAYWRARTAAAPPAAA